MQQCWGERTDFVRLNISDFATSVHWKNMPLSTFASHNQLHLYGFSLHSKLGNIVYLVNSVAHLVHDCSCDLECLGKHKS